MGCRRRATRGAEAVVDQSCAPKMMPSAAAPAAAMEANRINATGAARAVASSRASASLVVNPATSAASITASTASTRSTSMVTGAASPSTVRSEFHTTNSPHRAVNWTGQPRALLSRSSARRVPSVVCPLPSSRAAVRLRRVAVSSFMVRVHRHGLWLEHGVGSKAFLDAGRFPNFHAADAESGSFAARPHPHPGSCRSKSPFATPSVYGVALVG
jgi:hypothetical protein